MAIRSARDALSRVFFQRCFWLFVLLLALIAVAPFVPTSTQGRIVINVINAFLVVATVAAVGRSLFSFVLVVLLAVPTLAFQWLGFADHEREYLAYSWVSGAALYVVTVVYLLRYVFRPEVMTADKLFGAAAGYLMLGVLWSYFYVLVDYAFPSSFSIGGQVEPLDYLDALYFSMTVITSTGFGDIVPVRPTAKTVVVVQQVLGTLFVAILIARLAGVYPPQRRGRE